MQPDITEKIPSSAFNNGAEAADLQVAEKGITPFTHTPNPSQPPPLVVPLD